MQVALRLPTFNHHVDAVILHHDGRVLFLTDRERPGHLAQVVREGSPLDLRQMPLGALDSICRIEAARPQGEPLDVHLYTPEIDYSLYTLETPELVSADSANPASAIGPQLGPVPQLQFAPGLGSVPALFQQAIGLYPARLTERGWCQMEPEYGDVVIADAAFHRDLARAWEQWEGWVAQAPDASPLGPRSRLSSLAR